MLLGESATITRDVDDTNDDTDFRTELNDTLIYNGAAGTLTNNTLDSGNHTDHGYITNLGTGEVGIGHRGSNDSPNGESYNNAFAYKYGSGLVYYDTYPMDLWDGYGVSDTYSASSTLTIGGAQTYNENLIQWAASLYYDGASQINGTSQADTILGTMGDDVIFGDFNGDTLWGGDGADTFLYTNTNQTQLSGPDHIQDFDSSEDSIDISAITSGASVSRTLTNNTQFKLDIDNDSTYDMQFNLVGYTGTADDVTVVT
jgi:Ca2+-binding RTX toxin-like protein